MSREIICPYCEEQCEPTDYEDCNIGYAPHECEHCGKTFALSRTIDIVYFTWKDEE